MNAYWRYSDGGRAEAGFKGKTGDCVVRAIAIAAQLPYMQVYRALNETAANERPRRATRSSARTGVRRQTYQSYLTTLGWVFTPTMHIGSGCKVHLRPDELPKGSLIVSLSRHLAAVVEGIVYDVSDPSRGGTRCVYGYYRKANA